MNMDMDMNMSSGMNASPTFQSNDVHPNTMDMGTSLGTSMTMGMTFFNGITTKLYISIWAPKSIGAYIATCLFLIALSSMSRFLLAAKLWLETTWTNAELNRRYVTAAGKVPISEQISINPEARQMVLSGNGKEEDSIVVQNKAFHVRPWRITVDPIRALMDTLIMAVGMLIMLAVMTMNIGYFISVLIGTFIGSIIAGRYSPE
ncbi:Ctr type low affinity copper transporter [Golovinomyces cichoracearum]|uniref:Copper transport protein n=1 Tax=Golovinomyces cichoracearum TaxID=62708 RepID=A0A420J0S5_9PEZI|nr:Ctr type low affinity copper transporter [Golovinomyces cichoracearum]